MQKSNIELRNENQLLRQQTANITTDLRDQIVRTVDDQNLVREIQKIQDPQSFSALNSILATMNKLKIEIMSLKNQLQEEARASNNLLKTNEILK